MTYEYMNKYVVITRCPNINNSSKGDELFYVTYNEKIKGIISSLALVKIEYNDKNKKYSVESLVKTVSQYNRLLKVMCSSVFAIKLAKLVENKDIDYVMYNVKKDNMVTLSDNLTESINVITRK